MLNYTNMLKSIGISFYFSDGTVFTGYHRQCNSPLAMLHRISNDPTKKIDKDTNLQHCDTIDMDDTSISSSTNLAECSLSKKVSSQRYYLLLLQYLYPH